jgi:tryptophan-rich sensory protein
VWTILYGLIATSGARVYSRPPSPERARTLRLWAAQFGLNTAWSWLFFAQRRPRAALADCAALLATNLAYIKAARAVDSTASRLFIPYAGWVAFATLLNEEVVRRNPRSVG